MFTLKSGNKLAKRPEFCRVLQFSLINARDLGNFSEKCAAGLDYANLGKPQANCSSHVFSLIYTTLIIIKHAA